MNHKRKTSSNEEKNKIFKVSNQEISKNEKQQILIFEKVITKNIEKPIHPV